MQSFKNRIEVVRFLSFTHKPAVVGGRMGVNQCLEFGTRRDLCFPLPRYSLSTVPGPPSETVL